jgi:hypothetical protein
MEKLFLSKWYTRLISIFFTLIIFSLIADFLTSGFRPETFHKVFHIMLGIIIFLQWKNKSFYKNFPLINGVFFTFLAIFGWTFPDFALELGFEAFTLPDTMLHTVVGLSGLIIGFLKK